MPIGNLERCAAILCMAFSVTIFAYLMGAVSSIFGTVYSSQAYIVSMKQNIDDMLRDRQVVLNPQLRVLQRDNDLIASALHINDLCTYQQHCLTEGISLAA